MDAATNCDEVSLHSGGQDSDFNRSSISVMTSRDSESFGEIITRFEWDIACLCEKLTNLNFLSMHVETKESDFEVFVSDTDPDLVINALEYALLSGFLDSEVKLLEAYISELQMEIVNVTKSFSRKHLGESLTGMVDTLHDSEKSLELLKEDVLEIKTQSTNFEKNLVRLSGGEDHTESPYSIEQVELNDKMKINMHNAEHQRHVLKMLDKYLEKEIDLEKRVSELTLTEETLTMRLQLSEQEVVYAEVEAETTLEKFYETDHTSKLLMEISKELISKIKMSQLNLTGSQVKIQTDGMKDRCIFLSESTADIKKEFHLVKTKVKSLETSLHQMDETKKASARNIIHCSKFISDMVMQMTLERERIQKQNLSLKQENKILINHLKKTDFTTAKTDALSSNFEVEKSCNETARQLKTKDIMLVLFILIIPLFGVLLYQLQVS